MPSKQDGSDGTLVRLKCRVRWKSVLVRALIIGLVLAIGGLVATEIALRVVFGLGKPMLFVTDPQIEYMCVPGRYHRFGNTITINSRHMRAVPEAMLQRSSPDQRRVLVLGDSLIHGGNQSDDRELATVRLASMLPSGASGATGAAPAVLNVSCNSWGPPNLLAYVKRFGTFDCDTAVIVMNSWDYGDVPSFAPLSPEMPTTAPALALTEITRNYGPRYAPFVFGKPNWGPETIAAAGINEADPGEKLGEESLVALRELVELLRSKGIKVAAVLHPFRRELTSGVFDIGRGKLSAALAAADVPTLLTDPGMQQLIDHVSGRSSVAVNLPSEVKPSDPYRDPIHLSPSGQWVMANVLKEAAAVAK